MELETIRDWVLSGHYSRKDARDTLVGNFSREEISDALYEAWKNAEAINATCIAQLVSELPPHTAITFTRKD